MKEPNRTDTHEQLEAARQELLDLSLRNRLLNYRLLKSNGVKVIEYEPDELYRQLVLAGRTFSFYPQPEAEADPDEEDTADSSTTPPDTEQTGPSATNGAGSQIDDKEGVDQAESKGSGNQPPMEIDPAGQLENQDRKASPDSTDKIAPHPTPNPSLPKDTLQTTHVAQRLNRRLLNTYYSARTYIQERGVNILYLALGMLCWYEDSDSKVQRQAPLILVPIDIDRANVQSRFRIRYSEEEIGDNLSLRAKLKLDFDIDLPTIPEAAEDLNIHDYCQAVRQAIRHQPRWAVDEGAVALGFFYYSTFLMYNDLDATIWPDQSNPVQHSLLQALLNDGFDEEPPALEEDAHLDDHLTPHDSWLICDADSSQVQSILDVNQGRNLVIQGPPGTGKSQTITNIIAEALSQKKTVLFVAEKMAALEVVKRRLDVLGLGDACLELHSQNSNKRAFLTELRRTLELGRPQIAQDSYDESLLLQSREQLNGYCRAVNTPIGQSGVTPYHAYGRLTLLRLLLDGQPTTPPIPDDEALRRWTMANFRQQEAVLKEVEQLLARIGTPQEHPFWGSQRRSYLPTDQSGLRQVLNTAGTAVVRLSQQSKQLAGHLLQPDPTTRPAAVTLGGLARHLLNAPDLNHVQLDHPDWLQAPDKLRQSLEQSARFYRLKEQYDEQLIPEAWEQDLLAVRQALMAHGQKWWRFLIGDFRKAQNKLQGLARTSLPKAVDRQLELVDAVLEVRRLTPDVAAGQERLRTLFGPRYREGASNWPALEATADWLIDLHQNISRGDIPASVIDYLSQAAALPSPESTTNAADQTTDFDRDALRDRQQALGQALLAHEQAIHQVREQFLLDDERRFGPEGRLLDQPLAEQQLMLSDWYTRLDDLREMVSFNNQWDNLQERGLAGWLPVITGWPAAATHLVHLVEQKWLQSLIKQALAERPELSRFDSDIHNQRRRQFRQLDTAVFDLNRARLADQHWQQLPRHNAGGQLGVLRREFAKKRRHLPIRRLMAEAGNAIKTIKPVFMMSPLSIAMFLPPGGVQFDLVIFDEASQVRPVEAFGAILRGRQAVVVGDSKQLPPTSFFQQITGDADEPVSQTADLESILSLFLAQGAPQRMLRWHYRSQHESLITLSNRAFYDNKLVVFPSPDAERKELGLRFHHLSDTRYDRGGSRTNRGEAAAVAEAVMAHARHLPHLSLGVAAFSIAQMQAIQLALEELRQQEPACEGFFAAHPDEPFFVKNLENVQGDERDVIFISVGYGRDENGSVAMNFGPLNNDGGERRLNVLITRAKRRCEIFTNLTADDIDLARTQAAGVVAFQQYLRFAQTGHLPLTAEAATANGRIPPVDQAIKQALEQQGYQVAARVGSDGCYLDLAVRDPEQAGRYLMGISCDGPSYANTQAARDRDRIRPEVLGRLGWQMQQVWSTAWFHAPDQVVARLGEAVGQARQAQPAPLPPSAPPQPLTRHESEAGSTKPLPQLPAAEYRLAELTISAGLQQQGLHLVPVSQLRHWLLSVVTTEGPVHIEEAMRRIVDAYGVSRLGSRIRAALAEAVDKLRLLGLLEQRGDFLWLPEQVSTVYPRSRANAPDGSRKLELVAPEEIEAAVLEVVDHALGMRLEDIPPAACSLLGFGATSERMREIVNGRIARLQEIGKLVQKGDYLVVARA
jgi:flagellar biosynthesis GTPase FlhF